jgi:hypothetical protein
MVNIQHDRIITNRDIADKNDDFRIWFNQIGIDPSSNVLDLSSGKIIIIDPTYLADIYNENGEKEQYLKKNGILLNDFGGGVSGPILRTTEGGIKVLLVFNRVNPDGQPIFRSDIPENVEKDEILDAELGCDSDSYIFLNFNQKFRLLFQKELSDNEDNYVLVEIKPGKYKVGYEQWETDEANPIEAWKRNLIVWPC